MAQSFARARLNRVSQASAGEDAGRDGGPGRINPRSVLVVVTCPPRPMLTVAQAQDGVLDLGVATMTILQFDHLPVPLGDDALIAAAGGNG